jgi:hypothetical protein
MEISEYYYFTLFKSRDLVSKLESDRITFEKKSTEVIKILD